MEIAIAMGALLAYYGIARLVKINVDTLYNGIFLWAGFALLAGTMDLEYSYYEFLRLMITMIAILAAGAAHIPANLYWITNQRSLEAQMEGC